MKKILRHAEFGEKFWNLAKAIKSAFKTDHQNLGNHLQTLSGTEELVKLLLTAQKSCLYFSCTECAA